MNVLMFCNPQGLELLGWFEFLLRYVEVDLRSKCNGFGFRLAMGEYCYK